MCKFEITFFNYGGNVGLKVIQWVEESVITIWLCGLVHMYLAGTSKTVFFPPTELQMYLLCAFKAWTEVRHSCPCGLLFGGLPVSIHGEGWLQCPCRGLQGPWGYKHLSGHSQGKVAARIGIWENYLPVDRADKTASHIFLLPSKWYFV